MNSNAMTETVDDNQSKELGYQRSDCFSEGSAESSDERDTECDIDGEWRAKNCTRLVHQTVVAVEIAGAMAKSHLPRKPSR